jgi:RNA polymerase sigma-70 factor (ECF subfamily)
MKESNVTSLSLLARLRVQDQQAWTRLVGLYGPLVRHWCVHWGARPEDVEEVSQEAFLAASCNLERFQHQGPGSFRAWMRGIVRHKLLDHFRKQQGRPAAEGGTQALERLQALPEAGVSAAEEADEVRGLYRRALDLIRGEFEERTWLAFWYSAVEGRQTSAVAAQLDLSPVAVRIAKSRVLSRLRQEAGDLIE